jgi:hypothetical protein
MAETVLLNDIDRILRDGNTIYGEARRLREQYELQKKEKPIKKALEATTTDVHRKTFSPEMPDYYARLAGTKWTVVDEPFKPSASIQSFLGTSMHRVSNKEYDDAIMMFTHLSGKIRNGNISSVLRSIGAYLDVILWHTRETEQWDEYKKYYDEGIQMMELLSQHHTNDTIQGIALTYENYKNIQ